MHNYQFKNIFILSITFLFISVITLFSNSSDADNSDSRPVYLSTEIIKTYYDGKNDDLLTAGWTNEELSQRALSKSGDYSDSAWLRKLSYYNNTIALLDTTTSGGYGNIFGPKDSQLPISGFEYLGYSKDKAGNIEASLLLQIPDNMELDKPCLVVAASSGSRGIYGAVATTGSWALLKGCAVAYTDKGTGTGAYFFDRNKGFDVQGRYIGPENSTTIFSESLNTKNQSFIEKHPNVVLFKHANSEKNIERDFGRFVIQAGEFALYQLNQHFKNRIIFSRENTNIIAASISNGGGASLKAGEIDNSGLFDGIVVAEPNIYPKKNNRLTIVEGNNKIKNHSMPAIDYFVAINLYAPCALLTKQAMKQPYSNPSKLVTETYSQWCEQLKSDGYIDGGSIDELAASALAKMTSNGLSENHQTLAPLAQAIKLWPALATTYTNQIGKYAIEENLCSVYFSAIDAKGQSVSLDESIRKGLFANSNGIPPTAGIHLLSSNNSTAYQQAKCFYQTSKTKRIREGVNEITSSNNLHGVATIIVHGRNDQLIAPNHSSRPYYANANLHRSNINHNIRYYEITNAQHFDAFTSLPAFADRYIPLHYYFEQSLQLMFEHLQSKKQLPVSQVIHTTTRKNKNGAIENLDLKHLPSIKFMPKAPITLVIGCDGRLFLQIPD